ncbi:MAG TPA: lytic murein transglycosylase [Acidimicrobiales bacterium]|nr:lytic murein transglycosylase [Acidimicrobiales bacterium]
MGSEGKKWATSAAVVVVGVAAILLGVPLLALGLPERGAPTGLGSGTPAMAGIPPSVLTAYKAANGWCPGLRWQLVAGIGHEESGNATTDGARVDPLTGEVTPTIFGPPLDGTDGTQRLPIGPWLGWFGLPGPWQQAVGPLQFLPGTFAAWAVDVTGSGADPNNIYDAVDTAANYLCQGHNGAITDERAAILRYNDDEGYASAVLAYANSLPAT